MDRNSIFSSLSLAATYLYIYIGIYAFKQHTKSIIHRVFLALCMSYAIWSFAYAFAYAAADQWAFSIWNKVSAVGWCSFSSLSLYLVLLITDHKMAMKRIIKIGIFLPAGLFFLMAVFLFGEGINTPIIISNIFYMGNFLYNFSFLLISIVLLSLWGIHASSLRIKKQAFILVLSSTIPFVLNLVTQTILPIIGINEFPLMGQLYAVILIIGIYIVITKYKFLKLPEKFIFEEVVNEVMDMVIVLNEKGEIVRISRHTLGALGFSEDEVLKKNINILIDEADKETLSIDQMKKDNKKYTAMHLARRDGGKMPVNISSIRIFDKVIDEFLGIILVVQDISMYYELQRKNEELEQRAIRDGLTKLYNHQYAIELIEDEVKSARTSKGVKPLSVMMLDIDFFKHVNDHYGHQTGDYVLETISSLLMEIISEKGHVGRFGGEEFIVILPGMPIDEACVLGEKIRREINAFKFEHGQNITVSSGIKQLRDEDSVKLIKRADELLYQAKKNGRNRIEYGY
ncbi:MAG: diguanylate cyclase protein [Clostridia bacterium]|jgi:diguanylate cyclase (GGDEF)-like protein/PAS domain S-box-containing protein|nr:diguanylate cyclase protein [Clostridia bacterium]